jgi:signal transduction histidine kinase/CheY-like chemotaxis protein
MLGSWTNLSISKKIIALISVLILLIALEFYAIFFVMNTLSAVRTLVVGESHWSKAQKNSIQNVYLYALTNNIQYYEDFKNNLVVIDGYHSARIELLKDDPDRALISRGLTAGGVHPEDIPGVIDLLHRFRNIPYLARAFYYWEQGDGMVAELSQRSMQLHTLLSTGQPAAADIHQFILGMNPLNIQLTHMENKFSASIGEGSRALEKSLLIIVGIAAFTIIAICIGITVSFSLYFSRSLSDLNRAAAEIGRGNFATNIPIKSRDELGQLAQAINKMSSDLQDSIGQRVQAENANKVKSLFLANMSHEIRTPLGIILGMTEILKDDEISWPEKIEHIDTIERTGKNLTRIINDILDITKIESGHYQIEKSRITLPEFFEDIQKMLTLSVEKNKNTLIVEALEDAPVHIVSDYSRLKQILVNLIGNALKFTEHGTVKIRYGGSDSTVFFEVEDNGIGIPQEYHKDLFRNFSQIDSSETRKYEGTGLGLSLSKRLARALDGDLFLKQSSPGHGSTFVLMVKAFALSDVAPPEIVSPGPLKGPRDLKGKRVLIVDDSSDNQRLIRHYLTKKQIECSFADNGKEAMEKALSEPFDAILMDMQMPVMDGYTATQNLRRQNYKVPIIALTAHAMVEDRQRCIDVGCNDYLTKPVEAVKLYQTLEDHIAPEPAYYSN